MPGLVSPVPREGVDYVVLPDPPPVIRTTFPLMGVAPTGPYRSIFSTYVGKKFSWLW